MIHTKNSWVVRGAIGLTKETTYQNYEEYPTREKARNFARLLKDLGWREVKIYRATEKTFDDKSIHIVLEPVR